MNFRTEAEVIADSVVLGRKCAPRLVTFRITYPRIILPEVNTHRALSKCSSSTRAVPVSRMLDAVTYYPYVPNRWGANCTGMVAKGVVSKGRQYAAEKVWRLVRSVCVLGTRALAWLGVHKQLANQLITPFMWQSTIVTGTDWEHFFALRDHPNAHPEFQKLAQCMRRAMQHSRPVSLDPENDLDIHVPLVSEIELMTLGRDSALMLSAGRCAKVSYDRVNDNEYVDTSIDRAKRMIEHGHMSPFEHQAWPMDYNCIVSSNLRGWMQFRKTLPYESAYHRLPAK